MQDSFSIWLPAAIGLVVLFVFALLHLDRSESDPKTLDPPQQTAEVPEASATRRPPPGKL